MSLFDAEKIYDFSNRTFVVTGGTGVLGGVIVRALVERGANVAVLSRNAEKSVEAFHDQSSGHKLSYFSADVLRADSLEEVRTRIIDKWDKIDGLVNAAGGNHADATTKEGHDFFSLPEEALRHVIDLNLLGTILPSQIFGRSISNNNDGVILNISSMAADRPLTRVVGYAAAKGAIDNFTRWLAVYLAQEISPRLRVNAVSPGFFLTEQNAALLIDKESGEMTERGKRIIDHTPMGRYGEPEDLIGASLWLLSPAARFVTGIVVPVDGGFSAFSGV